MGGDGTANEVLNGAGDALPVGVLPGGGTNVLSRALGLSREIGPAAGQVGEALAQGRERSINLGIVNGRRFAFASGVGADAQAVRLVDDRRPAEGEASGRRLLRGADHADAAARRVPRAAARRVSAIEFVARGVSIFVANVHPWSYVGPFPLKLAPLATFEGGLDVVVPSDMRRRHLPRYATQLLLTGSQAHRPDRCSPTCTTSTTSASPAGGRCRCTPTATTSATSRSRLRRRPRCRPDPRVTPPLLFDLDGTLVDSRVVVERHWGVASRTPRPRLPVGARGPARRAQRRHDPHRRTGCRCRGRGGAAGCARGGRHRRPRGRARRARAARRPARRQLGHRDVRAPLARAAAAARGRPAGSGRDGVRRRGRDGKPDPEGFLQGARLLGVAPGACVAVEDAPAGIEAARAAGMAVIGITTTHERAALMAADAVIDDLRALDDALAALRPASDAGRLRPRMDLAITIGQGLGFGVACGLSTIALLVPLFWPGIDERALGILGASGLVARSRRPLVAAERALRCCASRRAPPPASSGCTTTSPGRASRSAAPAPR